MQGGSLEWGALSRCSNFLPKAVESPGGLAKPWGDVVTFRNLLRSWFKTLSPMCGCLLWVTGALGPAKSVSLTKHTIPAGSKSTEEGSKTKTGASAICVLGNGVALGVPPC